MISSNDINRAVHIVDESDAVNILIAGYRTSNRGRRPNRHGLRLLLIGMYLTVSHHGKATMAAIHHTLTTQLPLDEKLRLGVVEMIDGELSERISVDEMYQLGQTIDHRLTYSTQREPNLDDTERERRHRAVTNMCDAVMDVFANMTAPSKSFAIDATGVWSWGRGLSKQERERLDAANTITAHTDSLTAPEISAAISEMGAHENVKRRDLDAEWGVKTSKTGKNEVFFGYHEHAVVQVDDEHASSVPALLTRFELTPANADIVDVTLDLIDRNPTPIDEVIVDRHYHYKSVDRWKRQLIARGIEQHLDLRDNEHGFTESNRMRWAAGRPHCPATPDTYGTIKAPALGASGNDWVNFHKKIGERQTYEMRPHTQMNPTNDTERLGCPAEAGKVGCPLWDQTNGAPLNADTPNEQRAATVQTAVLSGLPIVENPPSVHDGEPLPACCTQRTVKVTVPESQLKLRQRHRWGTEPWRERRGQRSRVEGQFGNKKNPSVENLRRGQNQKFGLVWAHIVMAMVNASYNTRILQNWHDRNPNIELDHHPLFTKQAADPEFITVSTREYQQLLALRQQQTAA